MSRVVRLGSRDVAFPSPDLEPIESCEGLLGLADGGAALRARFAADGYVYLRGVLGADAVLRARAHVRAHLDAAGGVLDAASGLLLPGCGLGCVPNLEGRTATTHAPDVLAVIEGAPLRAAVAALLDVAPQATRTFDYKWLRAVPRGLFTGVHADAVYMSRGTRSLLTTWIPLDPAATLELGSLALARRSHASAGLARVRDTYAAFDTEAEAGFEGSGWLTSDPRDVTRRAEDVTWVGGDYAAGDVVTFGMTTLHMSTANATDALRLSVDVRWQRADEAVDDRYVGTVDEMAAKQRERKAGGAWAPAGAGAPAARVTMDDLRLRWGLDA